QSCRRAGSAFRLRRLWTTRSGGRGLRNAGFGDDGKPNSWAAGRRCDCDFTARPPGLAASDRARSYRRVLAPAYERSCPGRSEPAILEELRTAVTFGVR